MLKYMNCIVGFLFSTAFLLLFTSCKKVPPRGDYLSPNATFNRKDVYEPILGRTHLELTQFNADGSSYPMHFSIVNARKAVDGSPAPELFEKNKVRQWIRDYTGKEKSLKEIEDKRVWVEKPFFDIRSGSGDFIFYDASSSLINAQPDPGYLFDIKITNKGNERLIENFLLRPIKEVPYEPYEYDLYTRERKKETRTAPGGISYDVDYVIHPSFMNKMYFHRDSLMKDTLISVYIYKTGEKSNSLTFRFLDENLDPLDPALFTPGNFEKEDDGKWEALIHGFNMNKTKTEVRYDVAYPIPLTALNTKYATEGRARVKFMYSRRGFGGQRLDANFGLDFSIYEEGEWNISFYFRRNPIFSDD